MRIDAHQHFWKIARFDYTWMGPDLGVLARDYRPADLEPVLRQNRIDATVLVQTISSLDETRWLLQLSQQHRFIAGVVGWVDRTDPAVGDILDELSAHPEFVGVRHQVHDEPDDEWLLRPDVQHGPGELARRSVPYDLFIKPRHLSVSLETARSFPNLPLIIDHIAKPAIANRVWDDWADGITALAGCPNVACKLSGMITEADCEQWTPDDLAPYLEHVIEAFRTQRVLFGSDWPVCLLAGNYDRVVEALTKNLGELTTVERQDIFGNNAARWYRLEKQT